MDYQSLLNLLKQHKDKERAKQMSAYMRHQFQFLGLPTPLRRQLSKDALHNANKQPICWDFVQQCWQSPFREMQYVALDYLKKVQRRLSDTDIPALRELVLTKSWWDSVDCLDTIIGSIALEYPHLNEMLIQWSLSDNLWLRRVAIDHQLTRKTLTDTQLLSEVIENNLGQTEFFINKAIGWSLREYAKTNAPWVKAFIEQHRARLSPLSIREATKHF